MKKLLTIIFLFLLVSSCTTSDNTIQTSTRTFYMATTDFPHAVTVDAVLESFDLMLENTDMVMMHFDDGVPWQAALEGTSYPQSFLNNIAFKKSKIPVNHKVYLSMTPVAFLRNGLAENLGESGSEDLQSPWNSYPLDHPDVVAAYLNHCKFMINFFDPDYVAYAIEANMLLNINPDKWPQLVNLLKAVYGGLKEEYPHLSLFFSIQAGYFYTYQTDQEQHLQEVLPFTDLLAVSAYPFTQFSDPAALPSTYFSNIHNLAPTKPFAISETTWPAEDITAPYPTAIACNEEDQEHYMQFILTNAEQLNAEFISWFLIVDYDTMWEENLKDLPNAAIYRIWKDSGLYDGEQNPRKAQRLWHTVLQKSME